ncbi:MAG: cysteine peptidase family C39 domain-containing protein [Candidatus Berkelbacteria bacterium]
MKKFILKYKFIGLAVIVLSVFLVAMPNRTSALTATELQQQLQALVAQSTNARQQATAKKQEAALIQDQIAVVQSDISEAESAINSTQNQINLTGQVIDQLETNISQQQSSYDDAKNKLGELIANWYMNKPQGLIETLVGSDTVSAVVTKQKYFASIQDQITESMAQITILKNDLTGQKDQRTNELVTLQGLQDSQQVQKNELVSKKNYKAQLLSGTQGAINALAQQAADAEAKAALIRVQYAALFSSGVNWGSDLVTSIDSSFYYNQKNYPNTYIGNTRSTIADVGCFVTSLAMVATYYGKGLTPPMVAQNYNLSGTGLSVPSAYNQSVNWDTINYSVTHGQPVVAGVVFPGKNCSIYNNPFGVCHYIVIKGYANGKYLIHDPALTNSSYSMSQVKSIQIIKKNY